MQLQCAPSAHARPCNLQTNTLSPTATTCAQCSAGRCQTHVFASAQTAVSLTTSGRYFLPGGPLKPFGNPSGPLSGRCVHIVFVDVTLMSSSVQALDPSQAGATTHLVYERGEDVIVMKGYKFSRAKLAATAVLGCLASSRGAVAEVLAQVGQGS